MNTLAAWLHEQFARRHLTQPAAAVHAGISAATRSEILPLPGTRATMPARTRPQPPIPASAGTIGGQRLNSAVRTSFVRDIPFAVGVSRLPAGVRLGLRASPTPLGAWLRRWRRRPRRIFWLLDPATGHWHRL